LSSFLSQAGVFLVEVVFGFYLLTLLLRLLLQLARADFYNPFSQFIVALTNPPLRPLRRVIPGFFGVDWATVLLLVALKMVELWLVALLGGLATTAPALLLVLALAELAKLTLYVYIVTILVRVVLSWVNPYGARANPAGALLVGLTEPLLRPARRLIPPISGVDLSPIAVLVALQLLVMAVNHLAPTLFRLALGAP
jgi:YggT family protein